MEICFITGVTIIVAYLAASIRTFGIPPSISDTHYLWTEKYNNVLAKSAFAVTIMSTAILIAPFWITMSTIYTQWLAFIGAGALAFVGAACAFEEDLTHTVHYACAFLWAGASIVWSIIHVGFVPLAIGAGVALIGLLVQKFKNRTFWLEIGVIALLLISLVLRYMSHNTI